MKGTIDSFVTVSHRPTAVSHERVVEAADQIVNLLETMDCGWNDTLECISQILKDAGFPHRSIEDQAGEEVAADFARMKESERQRREAWLQQFEQLATSEGASEEEARQILETMQTLRNAGQHGEEARVSIEFWESLERRTTENSSKP
jgi:hypothetical protein